MGWSPVVGRFFFHANQRTASEIHLKLKFSPAQEGMEIHRIFPWNRTGSGEYLVLVTVDVKLKTSTGSSRGFASLFNRSIS